jgi:gliding motility-associated lipoprotein GldJ
MKKLINFSVKLLIVGVSISAVSCSQKSSTTGWKYNDKNNGGFQVFKNVEQATGPGLVLVEGGTFVMGSMEQDLLHDQDNLERRITVSSFYMDESEVSNLDYLEYLYWLQRVYGQDYPEVYKKALPDTLVWRNPLSFNEPFVDNYFRHPSYQNYPVVGVSWVQANEFCAWRTDRVNERILVNKGILKDNPNQVNEDNFNTDAYLAGQYEGMVKKNLKNLDPNGEPTRRVRMQDGILLPNYRLPTEAEWEYAAKALKGNSNYENVGEKKLYAWNGLTMRDEIGRGKGIMYANYKRGRGDNMGVAGYLNDNYDYTGPVKAFLPNDYGLYNMAGNVSEWVMDVYRPLSPEDKDDLNPFRGNVYGKPQLDADGNIAEKDSLGRIKRSTDYDTYSNPDKRGDLDDESMYAYGVTSMINNKARVYKGGSWNDRAYFLNPGMRRFKDEEASSADIGFRCAMVRLGSPNGKKFKQNGPNKK